VTGYNLDKSSICVKERNPKVKVVLMSAFEIDDKEFHNVLLYIKVDGFLQKPFSISS
jgi:hypothetical protein